MATRFDGALMGHAPIEVEYVNPPIPLRDLDYRATFVGYEPGDAMGWGRTQEAAIADLMEEVAP